MSKQMIDPDDLAPPREQRGYWRGFAAIDTMDEIERRVRNLFGNPLRGWVLIDWYESQSTAASPSIKNGLFLEEGNFHPAIHRDGDGSRMRPMSVGVSLTHLEGFSIWTEWATEGEARKARGNDFGHGDQQVYTWVEVDGGSAPDQQGRGEKLTIAHRNEHGATRHVVLVPQHDSREVTVEREARVIEAVADRMQAEDTPGGAYVDHEYVRGLAATVRANHYPLTWEK